VDHFDFENPHPQKGEMKMRRIKMKQASILVVLVLSSFLTVNTQAQQQQGPTLLRPTRQQGTVKSQADATVMRSQNVTVDIQRLRAAENRRLILPLFDGTSLTLVRDRQEQMKKGLIWYGKVAGEPLSAVTLSLVGEVVIGNIMTQEGKIYQIRYLGNRVHSLRQIDQSKFPREAQPIKPDVKQVVAFDADTCGTDPPTDIDIMVLYTDDARLAAGGNDAMDASVFLAVAETNQSYLNSNINQRLRLVHVEEVNYVESGNINTDLTALQNGSIGNAPTLRNTFAADNVVMITENGGGFCGLGYMMTTVSNSFEPFAYAVVARNCATGYFSFGHELGHNMGADHDCANATSTGPYPYNRGYVNTAPSSGTAWRTIMSYNGSPSSTRVQYWSNPGVNYPVGNDPMGGPCGGSTTDNHQVLNNTALTVANFRCSAPGINNVWMKDTWNDTGAEPDSHTAAEDMWKSPYIWVRTPTQDTTLVHQHEHQNPQMGSPNWVYVKLHNGGNTPANGNLELWYANASVSLSWPSGWTQIGSIPVSAFAPHTTKIVEQSWTSLPGTGHYCMIARWVSSSDPMTVPETADINANTRNNNNIVWRNLNIVTPDPAQDVSFIVRGVGKERMATSLVIRAPKNEMDNSFIRQGQVIVQLDDALMKAWRQGGGKGRGYKTDGRSFIITDPAGAVFENIIADPRLVGYVKLTFRRLPTTPRRQFLIDAIQMKAQGGNQLTASRPLPVIGGVSYEIHTDR
jgi:hypothetical protein